MTLDAEIAAYDGLVAAGLLEPLKEKTDWEIAGERQSSKALAKIEDKIHRGEKVGGFERRFYRTEGVGGDYINGSDDGEEPKGFSN